MHTRILICQPVSFVCILMLMIILICQPGFGVYFNAYENIDSPAWFLCVL